MECHVVLAIHDMWMFQELLMYISCTAFVKLKVLVRSRPDWLEWFLCPTVHIEYVIRTSYGPKRMQYGLQFVMNFKECNRQPRIMRLNNKQHNPIFRFLMQWTGSGMSCCLSDARHVDVSGTFNVHFLYVICQFHVCG